ncbi:MAG: hypothetical protein KatS3mg051_1574 [Anaerolineae bacterium]|nr:MAG: hypothetical protein KatS3mg051_1574 [Anaerolineae bacterium]
MPVITKLDFDTLLGGAGAAVSQSQVAWDMAREEAEHLIATRGRLAIPDDPAEAPAWARLAAAWLIYYTLIARTQPVQPELLEDARRRRQDALRLIDDEGARTPAEAGQLPGFGQIEELYTW